MGALKGFYGQITACRYLYNACYGGGMRKFWPISFSEKRGGRFNPQIVGFFSSFFCYIVKMKIHSSCEIEYFVETHICKLCVILLNTAPIYCYI